MSRVASVMVALLVAFSPILGETCVLRCHHDVACHRTSSSRPADAPCHQPASAPSATMAPIDGSCDELPFSTPALRPADAGTSLRALAAPAHIAANSAGIAIATVSSIDVVLPPGHETRAPRVSSTPLRL
jgi:hypothetical protein